MNLSSALLLLALGVFFGATFFSCSCRNKKHDKKSHFGCSYHHSKRRLTDYSAQTLEINSSAKLENTHISSTAEINGKGTIHKSSFGDLEINGHGSLDHVTVENDLEINGSGELFFCSIGTNLEINGNGTIQDSHIKKLEINGGAMLDHVTIDQHAEINGAIVGKHVSCPAMEINAQQISFENSTIGILTITYKKSYFFELSSHPQPVITLIDCNVEKIIFKKSAGNVIIKGSTKLTPDRVINGVIK